MNNNLIIVLIVVIIILCIMAILKSQLFRKKLRLLQKGGVIDDEEFTKEYDRLSNIIKEEIVRENNQPKIKASIYRISNLISKTGRTSLMEAARRGDVYVFNSLLDFNVNVDQKDNKGRTALMYAAAGGNNQFVVDLIYCEADNIAKDYKGRTALMYAAKHGHEKVIDTFLIYGDDDRATDNNGWTALMYAAAHNYRKCIAHLIYHGDGPNIINAKDYKGRTALMIAVKNGNNEAIQILLEQGANIYQRDRKGRAAIDYVRNIDDNLVSRLRVNAPNYSSDDDLIYYWSNSDNDYNDNITYYLAHRNDSNNGNNGNNGNKSGNEEIVQHIKEKLKEIH